MHPGNIILDIEGMSCSHCAGTVQKALESIDRISNVNVDLEGKKAYFTTDDEGAVQKAVNAVNSAGYTARPAQT